MLLFHQKLEIYYLNEYFVIYFENQHVAFGQKKKIDSLLTFFKYCPTESLAYSLD